MNEPTQEEIKVVARALCGSHWDKEYSHFSAIERKAYCDSNYIYYVDEAKAAIQAMQSLGYVKLDDLIEEAAVADACATFIADKEFYDRLEVWLIEQQKLRSE